MPALDGLRGLAIVLVFACHASWWGRESPSISAPPHLLDLIMGAGWMGVDLFFVLSGFLITGILLATTDSPTYFRNFFARRFLRIFPIYYLFIFCMFIPYHVQFGRAGLASLLFFYYNLYAVYVGHGLPDVNSLWSLAVEEQFYLAWPFFVLFLSRKALVRLILAGTVIALILRLVVLSQSSVIQAASYLTPCRIDTLLVGALLAIWHRDEQQWKRLQKLAWPVALGCFAGLVGIAWWTGDFYGQALAKHLDGYRHSSIMVLGPGCTLLAVLFAALIVKSTTQGFASSTFSWRPLRRIGKYSYGMYIVHWPVMQILSKYVLNRFAYLPRDTVSVIRFVLALAVSYGLAYLSFHYFEQYFLSLKRHFPSVPPPAVAPVLSS